MYDPQKVITAQKRGDTIPAVRAAGRSYNVNLGKEKEVNSAGICMRPDLQKDDAGNLIAKPVTPPNMKKWRQSYRHEVGNHFVHAGLVDAPLPTNARFGNSSDTGDLHAADCMNIEPATTLGSFLLEHKEAKYKSRVQQPLGRQYRRGFSVPEDQNHRFGVSTKAEPNGMMNILFDKDNKDRAPQTKEVDLQDVTQQMRREYKWPNGVNPDTHRFGKTAADGVNNGVEQCMKQGELPDTRIVSQRAERVRSQLGSPLGRTRNPTGNLQLLGENHVFGKVEKPDEHGARQCLKGGYTPEQQLPDKDLGISKRKLDPKNRVDDARVFGVPSIRYDKPAPKFRSVTSTQAYGNEENSQRLLFPSNYSYTGVDDDDFLRERKPEEIRTIFVKTGTIFSDELFGKICDRALRDFGTLSVDTFRHAWNRLTLHGEAPSMSASASSSQTLPPINSAVASS